jgi:hypothetical protein
MTLDVRARATALRLIVKYGKTLAYTAISDGVYDPATASTAPAATTYTVKAVVEDYAYRTAGAGFVSGLIRDGDKQITLAAQGLGFVPQSGDRVLVDGTVYTSRNVKATYSGEQVAIYVIHGRQ